MTNTPTDNDVELCPPRWAVTYNIVSPESDAWVGTGWEFFNDEAEASKCYQRHSAAGNVPTKRPFYLEVDSEHLGVIDRKRLGYTRATAAAPLDGEPSWITNLVHVRSDALMQAAAANKDGDDFRHGYHSGRAQVLESWIMSARISVIAATTPTQPETPLDRIPSDFISATGEIVDWNVVAPEPPDPAAEAELRLRAVACAARDFIWEPENWEAWQDSKESNSVAWPPEFLMLAQAVEKKFGPMPIDDDDKEPTNET